MTEVGRYKNILFDSLNELDFKLAAATVLTAFPDLRRFVHTASHRKSACFMNVWTHDWPFAELQLDSTERLDEMIVGIYCFVIALILNVPRPQCFVVRAGKQVFSWKAWLPKSKIIGNYLLDGIEVAEPNCRAR